MIKGTFMAHAVGRLPLLDVLRGSALVFIMLDHTPQSVLSSFTLSKLAFFDAAELFVVISGFLVGAVWVKIEDAKGPRAASRRFYQRSAELYQSYLVTATLVSLLAGMLTAVNAPFSAIWPGFGERLVETPHTFLLQTATFWSPPNLADVLALYVVLLAVSPLAAPLLRRRPILFFTISIALWICARPLNGLIPSGQESGGLLFNPFGWQLVFFSGAAIAMFRGEILARTRRYGAPLTALAALITLAGLFYAIGRDHPTIGETALWTEFRALFGEIHKWSLDEIRLVGLLAAAWLVGQIGRGAAAAIAGSAPGRAMAAIGRHGIAGFALGVLLSLAGDALGRAIAPAFTALGAGGLGYLLVDLIALSILIAAATALEQGRGARTIDLALVGIGRRAYAALAGPPPQTPRAARALSAPPTPSVSG